MSNPDSDPVQPPLIPPPAPPPKPRRDPGWFSLALMGLALAGMAALYPILAVLRDPEVTVPTTGIIFRTLGFFFFLLLFVAMFGVRIVRWLAQWFIDLLFGWRGTPTFPADEPPFRPVTKKHPDGDDSGESAEKNADD